MTTQKQIDANGANAQFSTGPKTAAGKESSASNAMTHGMTAKKYLTKSESPEEYETEYARRRRLYPPNDPIIDKLVRKIILAHFRIDRAYQAEAEMLDNNGDSLADVLVRYDKPLKHLSGYEASNRRTLKLLEEELARYVSMLNETSATEEPTDEPEPTPPAPKGPSPKKKKPALSDAAAKPSASTSVSDASPKHQTPPASGSVSTANAAAAATSENPETNPISLGAAPAIPKPTTDKNLKTNPISPGLLPPSPSPSPAPATHEKNNGNPVPSGLAAPISHPSTGENLQTNPISTGGCDVADNTTELMKSNGSLFETPPPVSANMDVPLKEPRPEVSITKTAAPAAPSLSVAPTPPTPLPIPTSTARPRLNYDINNWHVARPQPRR